MGRIIYKQYDRAGLDAQLNLRARWPDHLRDFARWAEDSAAARRQLAGRLDLAYGPSPGQRLDLFPAGSAGTPLIAFFHGGYWQALDKGDFSYLAPPFVAAGTAFASINYDLAPAVSLSDIVAQAAAAIVWLHRHGAAWGVDADRIFPAGHSAGGQLASLLLCEEIAGRHGLPGRAIRGAVSVSGVYDLMAVSRSYQQDGVRLTAQEVRDLSPLHQPPRRAVPLVCAVGGEETREFRDQQADLVAAWRAAGCPVETVDLPARGHFTAVDALGEPDHPLFQRVCALTQD